MMILTRHKKIPDTGKKRRKKAEFRECYTPTPGKRVKYQESVTNWKGGKKKESGSKSYRMRSEFLQSSLLKRTFLFWARCGIQRDKQYLMMLGLTETGCKMIVESCQP